MNDVVRPQPSGSRIGGRFAPHAHPEITGLDLAPEPVATLAPIDYEERDWTSTVQVPHRFRLTYSGGYRAAIPATIATLDVRLSGGMAELVGDAQAEIARFDTENSTDIVPFAAILLRTESVASSRIENLTASAKAIALAELGDTSKRNANVIIANVAAMKAAIALADQLDESAILDMHTALLRTLHPQWCGHWRDQQVWIGGDYGPHTAAFVPPHHDRVPAAMSDLVAFMRRVDVLPLAHAAVAHAQFETIHPFPDGNGRTGRAIVHSLLRHRGTTRSVTIPVSAGLLTDTQGYFAALTAYRNGDLEPIVEQFAHASYRAVYNGRILINELTNLRQQWSITITARRGATAHQLADFLLRQPAVDANVVQRELGVTNPSALTAIDHLVEVGVLRQVSEGKWGRKWVAPTVLEALENYSNRAGRRQP